MKPFAALYERRSGFLTFTATTVSFSYEDAAGTADLSIPYTSLTLELSGENSHRYLLRGKDPHSEPIVVEDPALLEYLARRGSEDALYILRRSQEMKRRRKLTLGIPIALMFVLLVLLPLITFLLPSAWLGRLVSYERERSWAKKFVPGSIYKEAQDRNGVPDIKLRRILKKLVAANSHLQFFDVQILLSHSSEVNAFALPGGVIIVNEGLLNDVQSPEEIVGVIGHELGHITQRHALSAVLNRLGMMGGISMLSLIGGADLASWMGFGSQTLSMNYSRGNENEADEQAVLLLQRAGISADGLAQFLARLGKKHENLGAFGRAVALFSTHPLSASRMDHIKQLQTKYPIDPKQDGAAAFAKIWESQF